MSITVEELNKQIERIVELRGKEAAASMVKKQISGELEVIESQMIEMLEKADLTTFASALGKATRKYRKSVRIPQTEEQRQAFFQYLKDRGLYDTMISVNSQKLNGFYNDEFEQARERGDEDFEIPGLTEVTLTPMLSFTKA